MVEEFKTLEDIGLLECPEGDPSEKKYCEDYFRKELRKEAIKQIKHYKKQRGEANYEFKKKIGEISDLNDCPFCGEEGKALIKYDLDLCVVIGFIEKFFNITEEELK